MRKVSTKVIPPTSPHRRVSPGEKAAPPCLGCARGEGGPVPALCPVLFGVLQAAGVGGWPRGTHLPLGAGGVSASSGQRAGSLHDRRPAPSLGGWQPRVRGLAGSRWSFLLCLRRVGRRQSPAVSCISLRGHQSHERPACTAPRLWAPPGGPTSNIITGEWGFAQESGGGGYQHSAGHGLGRLVQGVSRLCTLAPGPPAPRGLHLLALAAELLVPARPARRPGQCPSCVRSSRSA